MHHVYLVSMYSLHSIQTYLSNLVRNILGEGGIDKNNELMMNVIQMLHVVSNLKNQYDNEELKHLWMYF